MFFIFTFFKIGISVNEIEKDITEDEYNNLSLNPIYNTIEKERYLIPFDKYNIELDIFKGIYKGIIFAEIEFPSEALVFNIKLPNWFGPELSCKITNSQMAISPVNEILDLLNVYLNLITHLLYHLFYFLNIFYGLYIQTNIYLHF